MSDLDTLRAVHTAAAMQADHVADLWRVVRAGVQDVLDSRSPHYCYHVGGWSTIGHRGTNDGWCIVDVVTHADIARALGISRQRVGQLAAEPVDDDAREAWANLIRGSQ